MDRSKPNTTRWTLILRAQGAGPDARAALGELIRQYESFVVWLIRSYRHPPDMDVEDLKQSFLIGVLRRDDVARLDRERGSFRGWLRTAVRRFLLNEWDSWYAEKHGRSVTDVASFDAYHVSTPEDEVCGRAFVCYVVHHVLGVMRDEASDRQQFEQIAAFLPGPQMNLAAQVPLARQLGVTPTSLARTICVKRSRFRELVREAIGDTLALDRDGSPEDWSRAVDTELAELREYFCAFERAGVELEEA